MTPDEIDALPDYTDTQLLKLYRYALQNGWAGTTRQEGEQSMTFPPPAELLTLIERLEVRVRRDDPNDDNNDGVALAVFLHAR